MKKQNLALAACLPLCVFATLHAQQFDQVVLLSGSTTSGVITNESITDVEIEVRGAKVEVPVNTTAVVRVPTGEPASVTEGGLPAAEAPGVTPLPAEPAGGARFELGSGRYAFVAARPDGSP